MPIKMKPKNFLKNLSNQNKLNLHLNNTMMILILNLKKKCSITMITYLMMIYQDLEIHNQIIHPQYNNDKLLRNFSS